MLSIVKENRFLVSFIKYYIYIEKKYRKKIIKNQILEKYSIKKRTQIVFI